MAALTYLHTAFTKGLNHPFFTCGDKLFVCSEMQAQPRPRPLVETRREPEGQPHSFALATAEA